MSDQKPATLQAVDVTQTVPEIPLPEPLQHAPPWIAMKIVERFEEAAEFNALPGFEGDPRGKAVVASWKEQVQQRLGPESSAA